MGSAVGVGVDAGVPVLTGVRDREAGMDGLHVDVGAMVTFPVAVAFAIEALDGLGSTLVGTTLELIVAAMLAVTLALEDGVALVFTLGVTADVGDIGGDIDIVGVPGGDGDGVSTSCVRQIDTVTAWLSSRDDALVVSDTYKPLVPATATGAAPGAGRARPPEKATVTLAAETISGRLNARQRSGTAP